MTLKKKEPQTSEEVTQITGDQTEFGSVEPLLEQPWSPKTKTEKNPEVLENKKNAWYSVKRNQVIFVSSLIVLALVISVPLLFMPSDTQVTPAPTVIVPSDSPVVSSELQTMLDEVERTIDAADPSVDQLPIPPISSEITL